LHLESLEAEIHALKKKNMDLDAKCRRLSQQNGDEMKQGVDIGADMWFVDDLYGLEFDDFLLFKEKELVEAQA
jgi:hypothetical protein